MSITAKWYGKALEGQYGTTTARRVNWTEDTIKVMLLKEAYTPKQDEDTFQSEISTNEITGTGYSAGGVALGTKTLSYDATTNETRLKAATSEWTAASFSARYAAIYKSTGTESTSPLLGYVDFGGLQTVSSGTFKIEWDATHGVLKITEE